MHVGCSVKKDIITTIPNSFSTRNVRGLQQRNAFNIISCMDEFQYPRYTWVVVNIVCEETKNIGMFQYPRCTWVVVINCEIYNELASVLVPTMHVGCSQPPNTVQHTLPGFSTHDARGLQQRNLHKSSFFMLLFYHNVLHLSSAFSNKFQIFHPFFCSICFSSDFLVRIPLFHPSNRCGNWDFRRTIFYYYLLKCYYF